MSNRRSSAHYWVKRVLFSSWIIPEFRTLDRAQVDAILDHIEGSVTLKVLGLALVGSVPAVGWGMYYLSDGEPIKGILILLGGVALAAVGYWFGIISLRVGIRREVHASLRRGDVTICLRCHHDLRGLTGDRCPECGLKVRPSSK